MNYGREKRVHNLDLYVRLESAQYNREGIGSDLFLEVERHVDKVMVILL